MALYLRKWSPRSDSNRRPSELTHPQATRTAGRSTLSRSIRTAGFPTGPIPVDCRGRACGDTTASAGRLGLPAPRSTVRLYRTPGIAAGCVMRVLRAGEVGIAWVRSRVAWWSDGVVDLAEPVEFGRCDGSGLLRIERPLAWEASADGVLDLCGKVAEATSARKQGRGPVSGPGVPRARCPNEPSTLVAIPKLDGS